MWLHRLTSPLVKKLLCIDTKSKFSQFIAKIVINLLNKDADQTGKLINVPENLKRKFI